MNVRIIRDLLLIAALALVCMSKSRVADVSIIPYEQAQFSVQDDVSSFESQKFHALAGELHASDLSHLGAPVQESIVSVRRIETSRSEESVGSTNTAIPDVVSLLCPAQKATVNDTHCNSALCHNSRFYIYKFGSIRI